MSEVKDLEQELKVMRDCCHEMRVVNKELSTRLTQVARQLEKLADRIDGMVSFKTELARKDAEHDANYEAAKSAVVRAHERLDKVESNLNRAVWVVLTVVMVAVLASVGIYR